MKSPHYELIRNGTMGRLLSDYTFKTPIVGYSAEINEVRLKCRLYKDGTLDCYQDTEWDFGSWAVDTPSMVIASLAHDMGCSLTNRRLIPWKCRAMFDAYFKWILKVNGCGLWRYARWLVVSLYSQAVARWRDKK